MRCRNNREGVAVLMDATDMQSVGRAAEVRLHVLSWAGFAYWVRQGRLVLWFEDEWSVCGVTPE